MTLAIDCSNYTGELSREQVNGLYAAGVRKGVIQTVHPGITTHRQQIPALKSAGIDVEGYVYLWFHGSVAERVQWACDELKVFGVSRLWLDCEDVDFQNGEDVIRVLTLIREAVNTAVSNGMSVGIYTAKYWWDFAAGRSQEFSHLPLWAAYYDHQQSLDAPLFGGWQSLAMKQYEGDTSLAGVSGIDLNWYEEEDVETRDLTQREEQVLAKALPLRGANWLSGANGARGAEMVAGSSPRRVVITIPDDQWAEAERLA